MSIVCGCKERKNFRKSENCENCDFVHRVDEPDGSTHFLCVYHEFTEYLLVDSETVCDSYNKRG